VLSLAGLLAGERRLTAARVDRRALDHRVADKMRTICWTEFNLAGFAAFWKIKAESF
jgi:hypothetical protein